MIWTISLTLSIVVFAVTVIIAIYTYFTNKKRKKASTIINSLFGATVVSALILLLPVNINTYHNVGRGIFLTFQNMLQVFSLDASYGDFTDNVLATGTTGTVYLTYGAFLHFIAPLLTIGIILSFFKNFLSNIRLYTGMYSTLYIFSELNDKSLSLAKSCFDNDKKNGKSPLIVFTDVFEDNDEQSYELINESKTFSSLRFKKDILAIPFNRIIKNHNVIFFVMGADEAENIDHSLSLIEKYGTSSNAKLYSFINSTEGALLISAATTADIKMAVRRVNEAQSLVYHYLYNNNICDNITDVNGVKTLAITIVGAGNYGTELLKAIIWAAQIPDVKLIIDVFDLNTDAEQVFSSQCPEIMDMNNCTTDGEAQYSINFHCGINAKTRTFDNVVKGIKATSMAFIAIGDDKDNIDVAIKLRRIYAGIYSNTPQILSVVLSKQKSNVIDQYPLIDFKNNNYDIKFFGNIYDTCTYDVIINSKLEGEAKERHLAWYKKSNATKDVIDEKSKEFFRYEYYYKSSISSVIRKQTRIRLNVSGINKAPQDRSEAEKMQLMKVEHMGWNAYMRTEGYIYGKKRDDLAKTHPDLIPFDDLSYEDKIKDDF